MSPAPGSRLKEDRQTLALLLAFAAARLLVVLASLLRPEFGLFRDEFYYLACANRLALGYVDHPPLSIWVLAGWRAIAGDSLFSLRLLSGLIGAGIVFVAGLLTRQLGGSRRAQALACLITLVAPVQLGVGGIFSMNVIEYLVVVVLAWLLVRILQGEDRRLWIGFGVVLGIGVMNKHTLSLLAVSMLAGLVLGPARSEFRRKEFWLGMACAALIVLPNAILGGAASHEITGLCPCPAQVPAFLCRLSKYSFQKKPFSKATSKTISRAMSNCEGSRSAFCCDAGDTASAPACRRACWRRGGR